MTDGMKIERFNVHFQLDPEFTGRDESDLRVQIYARGCITEWEKQVKKAGGKVFSRPVTGIVQMSPDNPEPGISGLEPLRFIQVSGEAWLPPENGAEAP